MGSPRRWCISESKEAEVTTVTQGSGRQATSSRRECVTAMERKAQPPLIHAVHFPCLADLRISRPTVDRGAVTQSRRVNYSSSLRHSYKRQCLFNVLAAGTLTWLGVLQGTACRTVGAAAATASADESAAAREESGSEEMLLEDVLPALPYHGLLSPWIWFICVSSFFLLHSFCKQLLLWLRRERRGRTSKLALLLQSRVFPVHGLNRLLSTLHALVALNWGVLVLLERYNSAGLAECQSAGATSGGAETAKRLAGSATGVSGVNPPVSEAAGAPTSSKTPCGGSAASLCVWGFGEPVTSQERALLLFSLSYFIYDTCYEGLYGSICGCLHHGAAVLGLLNVLSSDTGGRDLIAALVVGELSTPLLHLRYCCIHFARRLTAVAASSGVAAPSMSSATPTSSSTRQQEQNRQQRDQHHSETGERRGAAATGDSDKESGELSANVSPASTASTALPSGSQTRSTARRSTPPAAAAAVEGPGCSASASAVAHTTSGGAAAGPRTGASGTAAAPSQTTTVLGEDGRPRVRGHSARGSAAVSDAAMPAAVTSERVAGDAPLGTAGGDSHGRRTQTTERNAVAGTDLVAGSAAIVAGPLLGAAPTGRTAAECNSVSARSRPSLPRLDAATIRSVETYSRPRVRNETFVRSGPNVHIPTPDLAATTGAAAILAAALGTAVAAAALGAAAPAGIATTAAIVAASCSFVVFSIVLRLSQRGGDPNSMFATSFHIPAGYVYPPSPRSQPHSAYGSAEGEEAAGGATAAAAAHAAALAQEREAAAAAFLKRSGDRIHSWIDAIEKSFFLLFVIGRAVLAPCVVYACVTCPSTPVLVRASGLLVLIVSCYWLFLLFRHVHSRRHRKEKKESLHSHSESHSATKERTKNTTQLEGRGREGAQPVG